MRGRESEKGRQVSRGICEILSKGPGTSLISTLTQANVGQNLPDIGKAVHLLCVFLVASHEAFASGQNKVFYPWEFFVVN